MRGHETNGAAVRAIEASIAAGKLSEARAALNALRAAEPQDVRVHLVGAMLARASANRPDEIASLQRVVELAPRWPLGHIELAKALTRSDRFDEGLAAVAEAVRLAPQDLSVLEAAVAIANAAGYDAVAEPHLRTALALRSDDLSVRKALALCLSRQQKFAEAETHWRAALAKDGDDAFALSWLGICLVGMGRKKEAADILERAVVLAPESHAAKFSLALARGETPRTLPPQLTRDLFDGYARRFDKELVDAFGYRVPERVAEMISQRSATRVLDILDLGCGTGLLALHVGRVNGAFVGVDLSAGMIAQAQQRGVYTELRQGELLDELRKTPAQSFDYIVSIDVFIYVGDLSEVIPAAFAALRPGGALIFSCETAADSEGSYVVRPSNRYAHSCAAVERLCRDAGFENFASEARVLRQESYGPIEGFIAIAQRPPT